MNYTIHDKTQLDVQIGGRVRQIRKIRGLTQTQLGNVLGITFQQIQKYERGRNGISTSALVLIARALDISPAVLFGDEGDAVPAVDWSLLSEDGAYEFVQAPG